MTIQEQLYQEIKKSYPDAIAKKINQDNFLDIHIPGIHTTKGTHLFFNTVKGLVKVGFYCRDEEFNKKVLKAHVTALEAYSQGLRLASNPAFDSVELAIKAANELLKLLSNTTSSSSEGIDVHELSLRMDEFDLANLNTFLSAYTESGKMVLLQIDKADLANALESDQIEPDQVHITATFKNYDWKGMKKQLSAELTEDIKNIYAKELAETDSIVILICEGYYLYSCIYEYKEEDATGETNDTGDYPKVLDGDLGDTGLQKLLTNIYILKPFYLQLNQTQEIFDLFDQLILELYTQHLKGNLIDDTLITEYEISAIVHEDMPEGFLLGCKIAQEVKYESDEYPTHIAYVQQLESFIKPLDKLVNTNFKKAFISMLIQLGNELDDDLNPAIAIQDRYLPIFYAFNTWTDVNPDDYDETLDAIDYPFEKYNFLKYTMRSDQLGDVHKMALAIYNFILIYENGELEIKLDDIEAARALIYTLFDYSEEHQNQVKTDVGLNEKLSAIMLEAVFPNLDELIGGFEDNFCFDVMQFFNSNSNVEEFQRQALALLAEVKMELNEEKIELIREYISERFIADLYRSDEIAEEYLEILDN
jgi:hypothetical protein